MDVMSWSLCDIFLWMPPRQAPATGHMSDHVLYNFVIWGLGNDIRR